MRPRTTLSLVAVAAAAAVAVFSFGSSTSAKRAPASQTTQGRTSVRVRSALPTRPATRTKTASTAAATGPAALFTAGWGGADGQLGHERPIEGSPTGPKSVAVDAQGRVHVLDGVNGRIVRHAADGSLDGSMPIGVGDPEDIALGSDGSTAVLDRFADKAVTVLDENGKVRGKLPLVGDGIDDPGSVTGVFVDGNDVLVERDHATLVKIGDVSGTAAEPRSELQGRPSRDGLSLLHAGIVEALAGRVFVASIERSTENHRFTRELRLDAIVQSIVLLDTDRAGTIYFAASVEHADGSEAVLLSCLDPMTGDPTGSAVLPANTLPEESFRDLTVLDGGGVIQALRTESGVSYTRYDCE